MNSPTASASHMRSRLSLRPLVSTTLSLSPLARYGVAVAAAAVTLAILSLRLWANPDWGAAFGFLICVPAIMLSGWVGGWGPGILTTLLCAAAADFWLIDQTGSWALTHERELLSIMLLVAVGAVISALNEAWRRSVAAAARARERTRITLERERAAREAEQATRLAADQMAEHLRLALQAGRMGTWEYRLPTGKAICSPVCEAMHGYSPGTLPETFAAVLSDIHADDRERVLHAVGRTLQEGRSYQVEYRTTAPDGTTRWLEARGQLLLDPAQQPERLIGVCTDVTERKQAEDRFRKVIEAAPTAMLLIDQPGRIAFANALAGQLLDYAAGELVGLPIDHFVPQPFRDSLFAAATRRPVSSDQELHAVRRDGTEVPVEVRLSPIETADGLFILAAMTDVSERRQVETSLRQNAAWLAGQKEAFQAAVNGAPLEVSLGILIRTAIEQTNGEARCAFYIVNEDRTELRHVTGMPAPYDRPVNLAIGQEAPGCGFAVSTGQPLVTPDVTRAPRWQKWLSIASEYGFRACWSFPVETAAGKTVGSFAMYFKEPRDATARDRELAAALTHSAAIIISQHQQSRERARFAQELEAASRQKDQFLAMLGHELRNPLFPIGTASELLSRTLPEDGRARFAAGIIRRQSAQLMRLVDDLLDIGRISQGRIQLRQTPLALADVIAQALETVEPKLREKQHGLSVQRSEDALHVHGDFARLVQCLSNVIGNAAKYTPPHGQIVIETRAEGDTAVISVRDNGVGITPELLPRVFELFVQGDRTLDRAEGGLGIGLSVVKRLIEMQGGEVTADSAGSGKGTRVEIRLPRIAPPVQSTVAADRAGAQPRRVLIVEDNADAADSLAALLSMAGHQTVVAYGGRDALGLIDSFRPEVALVDIGLPEINGYELARRLRANLALGELRLIAVTGYGQAEDRERARAAGFDEHLVKPVDLGALERTMAALCARQMGVDPGNRTAASAAGRITGSH